MKSANNNLIVEMPEKTMFSRQETATILGIGLSTLDSLITEKDLPRVHMRKRVYVLRKDLENFILANRTGGTV
jgi:hypothetical protein